MKISRVLRSLREVEESLDTKRTRLEQYKAWVTSVQTDLTNLATTYADVIAEINSYIPIGATETYCKDLLSKLITERANLLTDVHTLVTDLSSLTEF